MSISPVASHSTWNTSITYVTKNCAIDKEQDRKADAHQQAFTIVLDYIQDRVIGHNEVVQFASPRLLYIQELERTAFPSPDYRNDILKAGLESHDIHELIAFAKVNPCDKGCITYNLVYIASISVQMQWSTHINLGSKTSVKTWLCSFNESKSFPWSPTPDDLEIKSSDELLPPDPVKFLNFLICGDADVWDD